MDYKEKWNKNFGLALAPIVDINLTGESDSSF